MPLAVIDGVTSALAATRLYLLSERNAVVPVAGLVGKGIVALSVTLAERVDHKVKFRSPVGQGYVAGCGRAKLDTGCRIFTEKCRIVGADATKGLECGEQTLTCRRRTDVPK